MRTVRGGLAIILVSSALQACTEPDPHASSTDPAGEHPPELMRRVEVARLKVEQYPEYAGNWGQLGMLWLANDVPEEALLVLDEARARSPRSPKWAFYQARALEALGRHADALELARVAADEHEQSALLQLLCGELELAAGEGESATLRFEAAQGVPDVDLRACIGLARALGQAGQDARALTVLEALLIRRPGDGYISGLLGNALRRSGRVEEAREHLLRSGGEAPPGQHPWELELLGLRIETRVSRWARAQALLAAGRTAEAREQVEALLEDSKPQPGEQEDVALLVFYGNVLAAGGDFARAERALRRALAVQPEKREALVDFAAVLGERGRLPLALETARRAVELHPRYARAHHYEGLLLRRAGEREAAVAAVERALSLDERDLAPFLDLAGVQSDLGDFEAALATLQRARLSGHEAGDLHVARARALLELGRLSDASLALELAQERGVEDQRAYERTSRRLEREEQEERP